MTRTLDLEVRVSDRMPHPNLKIFIDNLPLVVDYCYVIVIDRQGGMVREALP
ncbi:MAG: hypothetical protein ACT4PQ_09275 [Betaproteobacteria bacterium]